MIAVNTMVSATGRLCVGRQNEISSNPHNTIIMLDKSDEIENSHEQVAAGQFLPKLHFHFKYRTILPVAPAGLESSRRSPSPVVLPAQLAAA